MEDRLLVGALRSRDPDAIGAVYDAYADRLYDYCWFRLRNRDAAQVTLRDTLMCADAHIGELRDPARFGPWLYAIARVECRRRQVPGPVQPDIPIARHDQDDVDLRVMAWRAVTALPPLSQELLDLHHRRHLTEDDAAAVVGLPAREVDDLLAQAGTLLEAAVIAEILAHEGPYECDGRAEILRHRQAELDDDLRESLVRHSFTCGVCTRHLPRRVSPAKVYDLLPRAVPPDLSRLQVTSCFTDPELAGYRLFAAARMPRFGAHGFPEQPGSGRAATLGRTPSRWPRALIAIAGALFTAVTAAHVARLLVHDTGGTPVVGAGSSAPGARLPSPRPLGPPAVGHPISAAFPLGSRAAVEPWPSVALGGGPPPLLVPVPGSGWLAVTPARLTLAPGGAGTITLRAVGGPVSWQASAAGPVRVGPVTGVLADGATAAVTVRAPADGPGGAAVVFRPGDVRVTIAWNSPSKPPTSTPTTPPPAPSPTPRPPAPPPGSSPPPSPEPSTPSNPPSSSSAPPPRPTPAAPSSAPAPAGPGATAREPRPAPPAARSAPAPSTS